MHSDWSSLVSLVLLIVMIFGSRLTNPPIHYLNKLEYGDIPIS